MMQGVDVLISLMPAAPFSFMNMSHEFYSCLVEENLMEKCKTVIVRIVSVDWSSLRNVRGLKAETIMKAQGLDPEKFKGKLCKLHSPHVFTCYICIVSLL